MLMLTDLVRVAARLAPPAALAAESPLRFGARPSRGRGAGLVVVWNVCRHCNMTCPHCYVAAGGRPSPGDLDTADALKVIDALADASVSTLIVSGGEPLLREDVFTLLERARERGLSVQLSSNGVLIDAEVARRLGEVGVAYVGVSIDGPAALNDDYRGLEGGFDRAVAALEHVRAAGLRAGLRTTLTRRNHSVLPDMLELARKKADRFYVSHLVYAGRGLKMMTEDLSRAETRQSLEWLFGESARLVAEGDPLRIVTGGNDSASPLFLHWVEDNYGSEAGSRVRALLQRRGGNSAGEKLLNIDHRGRVHPDQFWQSATLGRLPADRFEDILDHPLLHDLRSREDRLKGRCADCGVRELCRGSHRERAEAAFGDLWAPDPACVLTDDEVHSRLEGSREGVAHA
ncbi:MAG: radical SAM protein [Polyangiaceae bacterium]